jgi:hypothetical protein
MGLTKYVIKLAKMVQVTKLAKMAQVTKLAKMVQVTKLAKMVQVTINIVISVQQKLRIPRPRRDSCSLNNINNEWLFSD